MVQKLCGSVFSLSSHLTHGASSDTQVVTSVLGTLVGAWTEWALR